MLFIPIDVLMMKPKSHLTSGLNHVAWFILHCLVFREQSLVLSNRAAHLSDLFIVSHRFLSVKNFLNFFSKTSWPNLQATSPNRLPLKACWLFSVAVSLSDLYYDTRLFLICQHLFLKKSKKRLSVARRSTISSLHATIRAQVSLWYWQEDSMPLAASNKTIPIGHRDRCLSQTAPFSWRVYHRLEPAGTAVLSIFPI